MRGKRHAFGALIWKTFYFYCRTPRRRVLSVSGCHFSFAVAGVRAGDANETVYGKGDRHSKDV